MKLLNSVREHRASAGLTQEGLAKAVGVSRQTVIAIEKGEYTPLTVLSLRLAHVFGTAVEDIFRLCGEGD
jgi:putative transcriptional regulator